MPLLPRNTIAPVDGQPAATPINRQRHDKPPPGTGSGRTLGGNDMPIGAELANALRAFAAIENDIITFGQTMDASKASAFVERRREMAHEFAVLRNALEQEPWLVDRPERMTEALRLLSAFRASNSINQAEWPTIRVRDDPAAFRIAAQTVAAAARDFWRWVDRELGHMR